MGKNENSHHSLATLRRKRPQPYGRDRMYMQRYNMIFLHDEMRAGTIKGSSGPDVL